MVLNPALVADPDGVRLHMLFRATGPGTAHRMAGATCDPYPIALGYAVSTDGGATWAADWSRPALAPALAYEADQIRITDRRGRSVVNYANGCIEDPRIFPLEGRLYLSAACRMFPPGPYWEDSPTRNTRVQNVPAWARSPQNPLGAAAFTNDTVTVLFELDLGALGRRDYDRAFTYVGPLTDPAVDDNRDVFPFPRRLSIGGRDQIVLLHRPHDPRKFEAGRHHPRPSILLAAADQLEDLPGPGAVHHFLAEGIFSWEEERIGASWPPLDLGEGQWLVAYHGKTWPGPGYSQSFLIVEERPGSFPEVVHRCPDRLQTPVEAWEQPGRFPCPCVFTTAGLVLGPDLVVAYGAADQRVGLARTPFAPLVAWIRRFDARGLLLPS